MENFIFRAVLKVLCPRCTRTYRYLPVPFNNRMRPSQSLNLKRYILINNKRIKSEKISLKFVKVKFTLYLRNIMCIYYTST